MERFGEYRSRQVLLPMQLKRDKVATKIKPRLSSEPGQSSLYCGQCHEELQACRFFASEPCKGKEKTISGVHPRILSFTLDCLIHQAFEAGTPPSEGAIATPCRISINATKSRIYRRARMPVHAMTQPTEPTSVGPGDARHGPARRIEQWRRT